MPCKHSKIDREVARSLSDGWGPGLLNVVFDHPNILVKMTFILIRSPGEDTGKVDKVAFSHLLT